jgi:hypothetical protein
MSIDYLNERLGGASAPPPPDDKPKGKTITIGWTKPMASRFKVAYLNAALTLGPQDVFVFEDNEFLVSYAMYLVDYLEQLFGDLGTGDPSLN